MAECLQEGFSSALVPDVLVEKDNPQEKLDENTSSKEGRILKIVLLDALIWAMVVVGKKLIWK